jgi:hypothetical protein
MTVRRCRLTIVKGSPKSWNRIFYSLQSHTTGIEDQQKTVEEIPGGERWILNSIWSIRDWRALSDEQMYTHPRRDWGRATPIAGADGASAIALRETGLEAALAQVEDLEKGMAT